MKQSSTQHKQMNRLSRRAFVSGATALGSVALLGLAGCQGQTTAPAGGRWAGRTLLVASTGGAARLAVWRAALAPFERETGCRVQEIVVPDLVRPLRQQVLTRRTEWDLVALDAALLGALAAASLLDRLDPNRLGDTTAAPAPALLLDTGISAFADTLQLAYRTERYAGNEPQSWADAWERQPLDGLVSPRTLPRAAPGLLEVSLLADGVVPEQLYPLDLDRAFAQLDRIAPSVSFWWDKPAAPATALTLGEVDLAVARGSELRAALASGAVAALAPVLPVLLPIAWALPHGAPNQDVAYDLITFALRPAVQEVLAMAGFAPATPSPSAAPAPMLQLDLGWWHAQGQEALARFAAWVRQ